MNPKSLLKQNEIESMFNRIKRKKLKDLELDIGLIS